MSDLTNPKHGFLELEKMGRDLKNLFSQLDPNNQFIQFRSQLENTVADLAQMREQLKLSLTSLQKFVDTNTNRVNAYHQIYSQNPVSKKTLCDRLFEAVLEIGKPNKMFSTNELVEMLKRSGYSGRSFQHDPQRTVYNCLIKDSKKRFLKPSNFVKGGYFVINKERISPALNNPTAKASVTNIDSSVDRLIDSLRSTGAAK